MTEKWFTNMSWELDRGTQYIQNCWLSTTLAGYNPDLDESTDVQEPWRIPDIDISETTTSKKSS